MINGTLIRCHPRYGVQAAIERAAWIQVILSNGIIVHLQDPEDAHRIKRRSIYLDSLHSDQWTEEEWEKRGFLPQKFHRFPHDLTREGKKEHAKRMKQWAKERRKQTKKQKREENGQFTVQTLSR